MKPYWHVYLAGWLPIPWALDEDLSWVRRSMEGTCRWTPLHASKIVHAAWPSAVLSVSAETLRNKTVICQADNPPAFYLGTDGFSEAAKRVDLWIARSSEAEEQFRLLGLPVARVPYCVDPEVFRPLGNKDAIRRSLGIPENAYLIGNFHRDSEGADLSKPKLQKGPDVLLAVARNLHRRVPSLAVLLAGPRRHWLRNALRSEGIPVFFAGEDTATEDDYPKNILSRGRLNELYQALDVCVISSRWEGGPYAVLEALAAGCKVISPPVGTSRDVLPEECLFDSEARGIKLLESDAHSGMLVEHCRMAAHKAALSHGPDAVKKALEQVYEQMPRGKPASADCLASLVHLVLSKLRITSSDVGTGGGIFDESPGPSGETSLEYFNSRNCRSREDLENLARRIARARKQIP